MSAEPELDAQERLVRQAVAMDVLQRLRPALLHELRSPLQAILSALHMLRKSLDGQSSGEMNQGAQQRYVELIRNSVQQLIAASDGLLPRGAGVEREVCSLKSMTERILKLLRDTAALDEVRFELAVSTPSTDVSAVEDDLHLALTALLVGVLEESPPGSTLPVAIAADGASLLWTVRVTDRGLALADCQTMLLAEPRISLANTGPFSVARAIIAEHGGEVRCEPHADDSWSLRVRLPASAKR
jgi:signal transduction histidine kinase